MKRNYLKKTAAVVLSVAALTSLAACKKGDDHNSALDQTFEVVEAEVKLTPAEEIDAIVTTEYQIQSTMSFIGRSENALTADNALYFAADDKMTTAAVMSVKDGKAVLYSGVVSPDGDKKDAYVLNLPSTTLPFTYASNGDTGTFTSDDLGSFTLSLNEGENELYEVAREMTYCYSKYFLNEKVKEDEKKFLEDYIDVRMKGTNANGDSLYIGEVTSMNYSAIKFTFADGNEEAWIGTTTNNAKSGTGTMTDYKTGKTMAVAIRTDENGVKHIRFGENATDAEEYQLRVASADEFVEAFVGAEPEAEAPVIEEAETK